MISTKHLGLSFGSGWLLTILSPMLCFGGDFLGGVSQAGDGAGDPSITMFVGSSPLRIPSPLGLDWCLTRARQANPDLARFVAIAEGARHRVDSAGTFDDPRFSYDASNIPVGNFDFESTPLSGHQFGLRQKIPVPGLLSNQKTAAKRQAEASELRADDWRGLIDGAVETAWAELGFAQKSLEVTHRNIELARQLVATTESRYRVGSGRQQDVLRAQVELTALLQERLHREEALTQSESRLLALLDLPIETRLPQTEALILSVQPPALASLLSRLETQSARIRAAEKIVEEARLRIRVAELEGLPDLDFGIGYRIRKNLRGDAANGDDFLSAGLTLRLPINQSKWRARVADQRANLRRVEAELRGIRAALASRTRNAYAAFIRAASEEELLETGLMPQARQSF
ncbi:MAG: TolC family protein, partial [Myxococcota bacterium]